MFIKLMTASCVLLNMAFGSTMEMNSDISNIRSDRETSPSKINYSKSNTRHIQSFYEPDVEQNLPASSSQNPPLLGTKASRGIHPRTNGPFWISHAICGAQVYDADDLMKARDKGCAQLQNRDSNSELRQPTPYVPKHPAKYKFPGPYYLYPIKEKMFKVKDHEIFDYDRIVLNNECHVVGVLAEIPRPSQWIPMGYRFIIRRPRKDHKQKRYSHIKCEIKENKEIQRQDKK